MKIYGVDTLELNIEISSYDFQLEEFLELLEESKQRAQSEHDEVLIQLGEIKFVVKPKGQGIYSYKLECEDFHICFMKEKIKNSAPIRVRFISSFLWRYNYQKAYEKFEEWFENTFETIILTNQISRLDICCDIDEIEFYASDSKKIITRAKKKEIMNVDSENYYGKIFSGFTIGKGSDLMCRIYNKTLEIKKSNKLWFEELWKQYGWNGEVVWRIEFQARRKVLKEFNIEKVKDIGEKIERLWAYYTKEWCTLRSNSKDKNSSRWKVSKKWEKIQKISIDYDIEPLSREKIKRGDEEKLLNLCIGSFTSLSAIKNFNNPEEACKYLIERMEKRNRKKDTSYKDEVEKKKNRYIKG